MSKEYIIIEEAKVETLLTTELAISAVRKCFEEKAKGTFKAHAKVNIQGKHGSLRITPGESEASRIIGFRLYDVIRADFSEQPQLTVVYDNTSGILKGIVISQLLGAYRTAAINAVIQEGLRKQTVDVLGVVGTGYQANFHVEAFIKVLKPKRVLVYGRTKAKAEQFVKATQAKFKNIAIILCESMEDLRISDAVILATRSQSSLLKKGFFNKGVTITTIGPKIKGRSEVSEDFALSCDRIVTDSMEQVEKYGEDFFIGDRTRILDYTAVLLDAANGRQNEEELILVCSVGMGGTEVAIADAVIERKRATF